jgi:patatin-like phospholipase/acyl hydrolase
MSKKNDKNLSIDGGGIRGIIPALVLAEIEKRTKKTYF